MISKSTIEWNGTKTFCKASCFAVNALRIVCNGPKRTNFLYYIRTACGTCAMGDSSHLPGGGPPVVDSAGRVIGAEGLRVVDASIFPTIPNGNLNGPTIMVAEKLSDAILGREPLPPLPLHRDEEAAETEAAASWWTCDDWESRQREAAPVRKLY
jgi:choline dehydrogenase